MAQRRNKTTIMFSTPLLKKILSKHHYSIQPDLPVYFRKPRETKMADIDMEAGDQLDYEPADTNEETDEEATEGHSADLTTAEVNKLLESEAEPVSNHPQPLQPRKHHRLPTPSQLRLPQTSLLSTWSGSWR